MTDTGESRSLQSLRKAVKEGRLAHGILLHGESLETLEREAFVLAGDLLEPIAEDSYKKHPTNHPDLFEIRPAGKSRTFLIGEAERGHFPPNTIRRLTTDIQMTSNQGGNKVAIIHEADRLVKFSANALLKTLEEPPENTYLILLTTNPYKVMSTIRSRCFRFHINAPVPPVDNEDWIQWKTDYGDWIKALGNLRAGGKPAVSKAIFGLYGLAARFDIINISLSADSIATETSSLPENASKELKDAAESRVLRGKLLQLLQEVEKATGDIVLRGSSQADPESISKYIKTIAKLEELKGLLVLNLKDITAFEYFMLHTLRIWSQA